MLSVADCGIVSAGTYSQVNFKEKIMVAKKPVKKEPNPIRKAASPAEKAASKRATGQAYTMMYREGFRRDAQSDRLEKDAMIRNLKPGIYEGGTFYSGGLLKKDLLKSAKSAADRAKTASNQMKKGITQAGGNGGTYDAFNSVANMRKANAKSKGDTFKANQVAKQAKAEKVAKALKKK